jgi:hypothetical protein
VRSGGGSACESETRPRFIGIESVEKTVTAGTTSYVPRQSLHESTLTKWQHHGGTPMSTLSKATCPSCSKEYWYITDRYTRPPTASIAATLDLRPSKHHNETSMILPRSALSHLLTSLSSEYIHAFFRRPGVHFFRNLVSMYEAHEN